MRLRSIVLAIFLLSAVCTTAERLPATGSDSGTWGTILNAYLMVGHSVNGTHANVTVSDALVVQSEGLPFFLVNGTSAHVGIRTTWQRNFST